MGPLENDPLISALLEFTRTTPLAKQPDYVLSLGTGKPTTEILNNDRFPNGLSKSSWKNKALPRLIQLLWEKMRDKNVRNLFYACPWYHRLDIEFDDNEPSLDDIRSIPLLQSIAERDISKNNVIERIANKMVASLFYFELDALPERLNGRNICCGRLLCLISVTDSAFSLLMEKLSKSSATFKIPYDKISGNFTYFSQYKQNFEIKIKFIVIERFYILLVYY